MRRLAVLSAAVLLVFSSRSLPTSSNFCNDLHLRQGDCSDTVSMMQLSMRTTKISTQAATRRFHSTIVPYTAFVANRSEVTSLPENYSLGQLFAYEPTTPANSDLFVFLPGSWVGCTNYTQLLETAAPHMMSLCLPYDNIEAMGKICGGDSNCWYKKRLEAYNGSFDGIKGNNAIARLQSALEYLGRKHGPAWARYLGSSGPRLESMRFAGHSQGAGLAAMTGYQNKVARVIQFSGPCDASDWAQTLTSVTSADRYFGMASYYDRFCDWESRQVPAWYAEGIVSDKGENLAWVTAENVSSFDPDTSQSVISTIPSPVCKYELCLRDAHDSTALDKWPSPKHAPYAEGLWQRLIGI